VRRLLVIAALLLAVAGPAPAGAQATTAPATAALDEVAADLRRDPVHVDPDAENPLSDDEADDLRAQIADAGVAVWVAVLPASVTDEVGGDAGAVATDLLARIGLSGTVAVVVGDSFRAQSNAVPTAGRLATEAFAAGRSGGPAAVLEGFVDRVADAGSVAPGGSGGGAERPATGDGDDGGLPGWVLPAALVGGGAWWLSRRRRGSQETASRRRQTTAEVEALRASAQLLGEDVLALEPHISLEPAARADYEAALSRFRFVQSVLPNVDTDEEVARTQRVLDEGHYAMSRARARVEGREPPPPPEELARPGAHDEPALRVDERGEPVYAGSREPFYGGGGWFGGGGGMLSGLLIGHILGGMGGWGWGGHMGGWHGGGSDGDGDDGRFGGDWGGGGDWGAGGGGDWGGGGDIGGGDW
jgi:hypothetical protein